MSLSFASPRSRSNVSLFGWMLVATLAFLLPGQTSRLSAEDQAAEKKATEKKEAEKGAEGAKEEKQPAAPKPAEAPKTPADPKAPAPAAGNPLLDLIKRGLGPGQKKAANAPPGKKEGNATDGPTRSVDRHSADPSAPYDRAASGWMARAQTHATAKEWKSALELLQRVTDQPEDSLYRTEAGQWVSIRAEADRRRGEVPPEVLAEYRTQYDGLARQLLNEAIRTGSPVAFGRVAKGYFHTEAGHDAANRLGSLHLDRGEFALAAHWFKALWQARPALTRDRSWRTKAAYAFKQAHQPELALEVIGAHGPGEGSVEVGGKPRELSKWLESVPLISPPGALPLSEWLTFLGSPARTGIAVGGEPLLLPRWRVPLTSSYPARQQVEQLMEDLSDNGIHVPPMLYPTMAGGKIAFRTLHGVQVVEAASGRLLWQTDEDQPIEKLVSVGSAGNGGAEFGINPLAIRRPMGVRRAMAWSNGMGFAGSGEYSPLCHLLYRNAGFGMISSDGRRLFVVDDPFALTNRQPGNAFQGDGNPATAGDDGSQLTAYDLDSGRPLWEIGGSARGEPFDPPLAGYFFFGPPVADGGELFVVAECTTGEKTKQIRLLALDPHTGTENWSQLLAYSDLATIDKDVGRRWWAAPVAADNGILICPTTVGWIVAVDRVTRSLLWGHRTQPAGNGPARANMPTAQVEAMAMVQNIPLNGTWSQTPPILANGRIVWAPLESGNLLCLDQMSGKELWMKPRQNLIYVAGVFEGKVVTVGRDATTAWDLQTGTQLWQLKTPAPSGRGIATSGRYLLPLSTGEVWDIDLASGKLVQQAWLPTEVRSIGNLALYEGMLLSLDANGLTAFEQRDAVRDEIANRKRKDPRDPQALIREAEILLLNREFDAALASLRTIEPEKVPGDLGERLRQLLVETRQATIRSNLGGPDVEAEMKALESVSTTVDDRRRLRRLQTELYLHRAAFGPAFDAYLEMAAEEGGSQLVPRDDALSTTVRERLWIAGKIADLFARLSAEDRPAFDQRVAALAKGVLSANASVQERFLEVVTSHPAGIPVRDQLIDNYARAGRLSAAERHLLLLAQSPTAEVAAVALERRARLLRQFDLGADAALTYAQLERLYPEALLAGKQTARNVVGELRRAGKLPPPGTPVVDWQATSLRAERSGAHHTNYVSQVLTGGGADSPFFYENRMEVDPGSQRLTVMDAATDDVRWELPLRTNAGSNDGQAASVRTAGHLLVLLHRGVLHCLAPAERLVLWSRPLDERQAMSGYVGRNVSPVQPMSPTLSLTNRQIYNQDLGGGWGSLALATDEIIVCQGRRQMTVFDTRTGDVRWNYQGIRAGSSIFGGKETLFVRPADGQNCVALRALDGKKLDVGNLNELLNRAVQSVDDAFVMPISGGPKGGLRAFDPVAGKERWKVEFARGTLLYPLDQGRMALLETGPNGGAFSLLDLSAGVATAVGSVSAEDLKGRSEVYAVADNQNVYLVINKGSIRNYYSEQIPFVRANGTVFAFDPLARKLRWRQTVTSQNLILERLEFSPIVLFAARNYETQGKVKYWSLHLIAVDKLSGARLFDEKSASQTGFRSVNVSAGERFIELRGYNDRVRLYPVEASAAAGEAGD